MTEGRGVIGQPASGSSPRMMRGMPKRLPRSALSSRSSRYDSGRTDDAAGNSTHGCVRQKSPRVSASSATSTSSSASMSSTVRVCGTTTSIVGVNGQLPRTEITPRDGVYATSALFDAGERPLDHVSSPRPNAARLAAVDAPEPFDEPDRYAAAR
ncbi:Uncharacterised protein [Mycobacteroides abscessus subsp. abscessus]|nr:Uncharacterised protein [Mycobacteroides abscessus subsp. abscessus]